MPQLIFVLSVMASLLIVAPERSLAQSSLEAVVPVSEVQRQVVAALATSNATLEATKRRSDRALRRKLFEIEDLQAEIADLEAEGATTVSELNTLRDRLAAEQQRFVDELAERDQFYADEIATYRRAVEDIAATPEGLAALERFNAGEEAEALEILDLLRTARDLAAARRIAQLALDAWRRSKVSTQSVVARFDEITRLDPQGFWDWIELSRLQVLAGDLVRALQSAKAAEAAASSVRERSVASLELGDISVLQGDLTSALTAFERTLQISEQLAEADPSNALAQRDVSYSLGRLGDVWVTQGDLTSALTAFERMLQIDEQLAEADPSNAEAQRDVALSYYVVGQTLAEQGLTEGAVSALESALEINKALIQRSPNPQWLADRDDIDRALEALQ